MEGAPVLEIKELQVQFPKGKGWTSVVHATNFILHSGEILGIVGESGSGKSITALAIMGLLPFSARLAAGCISYLPRALDLHQQPENVLETVRGREIAMIFQEPMTSLNPVLRCGEQLTETLIHHLKLSKAEARRQALGWLEKVELKDTERIFKAYPHQLSGGQKQRVMIAMAMSCRPKVIIADEPTTALDVTVQHRILQLLKSLCRELETAVIFISHDLGVIAEMADRVLVMQQGHIVEQGTVAALFDHPQHAYTKGLLACRPVLGKRYRRLPELKDFVDRQSPDDSRQMPEVITAEEQEQRLQTIIKNPPLLEVDQLKVFYADQSTDWQFWKAKPALEAVAGVSFQLYPGETLGLVGESGCGKTTLAKTIMGLAPFATGSICFAGERLNPGRQDRSFYRKAQMIFQDPYSSLNPRLPIGEAIVEPMRVHRIGNDETDRKQKAKELLERVGLEADHYYRYPHEFSGGQRQRICIARALSMQARFIICDEVVSALDVSVQAQVLNLLKDLQDEKGLSYLFISHDLSVVEFMSDRILVMQTGKIVEEGPAHQLYEQAGTAYTQELIAAVPGKT